MADKNIFETLTQYRLKLEKDGKNVADVPSILALPALLVAPKLSIAGLVAAPLLGMKVHVETEDGSEVDVGGAVRDAAQSVGKSVSAAAKTFKEEIDKAWEAASADDPEEAEAEDEADEAREAEAEATEAAKAAEENLQDIVEDLEKQEKEEEVPTIKVNPEDSANG